MILPPQAHAAWSPADVDLLTRMREAGINFRAIGKVLRRTEAACRNKYLKVRQPGIFIPTDTIIDAVAHRFNVPTKPFRGPSRARSIARPRQVAMYLTRRVTGRSYPQIGRSFGGRDHTTVLHAMKQIEKLRRKDKALDCTVAALEAELTA